MIWVLLKILHIDGLQVSGIQAWKPENGAWSSLDWRKWQEVKGGFWKLAHGLSNCHYTVGRFPAQGLRPSIRKWVSSFERESTFLCASISSWHPAGKHHTLWPSLFGNVTTQIVQLTTLTKWYLHARFYPLNWYKWTRTNLDLACFISCFLSLKTEICLVWGIAAGRDIPSPTQKTWNWMYAHVPECCPDMILQQKSIVTLCEMEPRKHNYTSLISVSMISCDFSKKHCRVDLRAWTAVAPWTPAQQTLCLVLEWENLGKR